MANRRSPPLKAWAAISFGMGSLLIFTGIITSVMFGDSAVSNGLGPVGGLSLLSVIGAMLWVLGLILLLLKLRGPGDGKRSGPKQVLLRGRDRYRCGKCGTWLEVRYVDYHELMTCGCGERYDMFQEFDEDQGGVGKKMN
ncbi:MAG: hypothetical protein KAH57_08055 [Thermoplasmata archaeon]|nr:hypothetical protein [Thermoplasmata archaeon]